MPTSVYMGVNNGFVDYLADPAEVLARSIETGETIPEIFNDVFKLREQNLSDKMGKITPLRVIRISQVKGFKILPGGKDVCIEGWQQRRLMGDLKPDDPKFVKVEEKYIRLYFANGGNGIIAADILKKKGIAGASSVEVSTTDIPATARNIKKLIKMGMFAQFPKNDTGKRITQNIY